MLIMFAVVFAGIREFSVHKEIVDDKIDDDTLKSIISSGDPLPPDVIDMRRNTFVSRVFPEPVATGAAADRRPSPAARRTPGWP